MSFDQQSILMKDHFTGTATTISDVFTFLYSGHLELHNATTRFQTPHLYYLLGVPHGVVEAAVFTAFTLLAIQLEEDVTSAVNMIQVKPETDTTFHGRPAMPTFLEGQKQANSSMVANLLKGYKIQTQRFLPPDVSASSCFSCDVIWALRRCCPQVEPI